MEDNDTHIEVGETAQPPSLLDKLGQFADEARREELRKQLLREHHARQIAEARWTLATEHHLTEKGQRLDFSERPYLVDLYKDVFLDRVIYGAAQFGKSELELVDIAATAMYGFACIFVTSTGPKRDRFVNGRMNPCFEKVPAYRNALAEAKSLGHDSESVRQKGFGSGTIAAIAATAPKEFTSTPGDAAWVDEYQECDTSVLELLDDRFSNSPYRAITRLGHPTVVGTEDNANLDWLYQNSDQRKWEIPCQTCKRPQVLNWWEHIVSVKYNKHGAIIDVKPRDQEYRPGSKWDLRAICKFCHRPMNRISRTGNWRLGNPDIARHGWKLGNLYAPNKTLKEMYDRFARARYKPVDLGEFVNKQLGETWGSSGNRIEEYILQSCADGDSQLPPYKFYPVSGLAWRRPVTEEAGAAW